MCDSCNNIKHSFFVRKILFPISILFNVGLTIYLIISNTLNYDKYQKRESYVVYYVPNTTSNYYIIRENINGTINCNEFEMRAPFEGFLLNKDTGRPTLQLGMTINISLSLETSEEDSIPRDWSSDTAATIQYTLSNSTA
ncbi:unnamed protein product [Adineta steineri]|uniref:Uncharacterized protein n=1 Tax=Adineta steineri TaxID=433720 RepID=A0A815A9F7_9BILA|nr:unnamed protein product [Adineta steineri]